MKYKLVVNEKQAKIISWALDFYSRTMGGQLEDILCRFHWRNLNDDKQLMIINLEKTTNLSQTLTLNRQKISEINNFRKKATLLDLLRYLIAMYQHRTY